MEKAIYKHGETHLQTTVHNGLCAFTAWQNPTGNDYTISEYLDILGTGHVCIPMDEAMDLIDIAMKDKYIGPWEEITEEQWTDALECLPPCRWMTVDGVNFFQMSERMCGSITGTYARYFGKCYTAFRQVYDKYENLAQEIKHIV